MSVAIGLIVTYSAFAGGGKAGEFTTGCEEDYNSTWFSCDENGLAFVYYKITDKNAAPNSFDFPVQSNYLGGANIVGCKDYGGFWILSYITSLYGEKWITTGKGWIWNNMAGPGNHDAVGTWQQSNAYGRNSQAWWKYARDDGYKYTNTDFPIYDKSKKPTFGNIGARSFSYLQDNYGNYDANKLVLTPNITPGDFVLGWKDGSGTIKPFASLEKTAPKAKVSQYLQDTIKKYPNMKFYDENGGLLKGEIDPTKVSWFCSDISGSEHTFSASSSGYAIEGDKSNTDTNYKHLGSNKTTVVINKETTKVKIVHTIKHESGSSGESLAAKYLINGSSAGLRENKDGTSSDVYPVNDGSKMKTTSTKKAAGESYPSISKVATIGVEPGQKKEAYSTIYTMRKYDGSYSNPGGPGRYSIFLYRPPAYFNAKIQVSASGVSGCSGATSTTSAGETSRTCSVKDGKYTVTFGNYVTRNDTNSNGTAGGSVKSAYTIESVNGNNSSSSVTLANKKSSKSINNKIENQTLDFGESKTYSNKLTYDSEVNYDNNKNKAYTTRASVGPLKVKVSRESAKFKAEASIKNDNTELSSSTVYLTDGIAKLKFGGIFSRDPNEHAGGSKEASYRNVKVYIREGNVSKYSDSATHTTGAIAENGNISKTFPYSINGGTAGNNLNIELNLNYGETKTVCVSFEYAKEYAKSSKYSDYTTATKCVKFKRPDARCIDENSDIARAYDFGIDKGRNIARIKAYGFNADYNLVTDWTHINTENNEWTKDSSFPNNRIARRSQLVLRPDYRIRFDYQVCGGALFPIMYHNVGEYSMDFEISGTRVGYTTPDVKEAIRRYTPVAGKTSYSTFFKGSDGEMETDSNNKYLFPEDVTKNSNPVKNPVKLFTRKEARDSRVVHNDEYYDASKTKYFLKADLLQGRNGWTSSKWTELVRDNYFSFEASSPTGNKRYEGSLVSGGSNNDGYVINNRIDNTHTEEMLDVGKTIAQQISWYDVAYVAGASPQASNMVRTAEAKIAIPYNYELITNIQAPKNGVAYSGDSISFTPEVRVAQRKNLEISSNSSSNFPDSEKTYATITKNTHYELKMYVKDTSYNRMISSKTVRFNKDGKTEGTIDAPEKIVAPFTIPETLNGYTLKAGDKLCVDFTVWPMDSHDLYKKGNLPGHIKEAMSEDGTTRETRTACVTIAKRPTMSVESSNVYSRSGYKTTAYVKKYITNGADYLFGSWSEYGVFGKVSLDNMLMTSGASLGYVADSSNSQLKNINDVRDNVPVTSNSSGSGSSSKVAFDRPTGDAYCRYMTQTFANNDCKSDNNSSKVGGVSAKTFVDRLNNDYKSAATKTVSDLSPNTVANSDIITKGSSKMIAVKKDGDAELTGIPDMNSIGVNTIVYNVTNNSGTATININGNIEPNGNYDAEATMEDIADVKKIIIFADNVNIAKNVEHIDATIIAKKLNTCTGYSVGGKLQECGKQLIFSSPVIVSQSLELLRSYGAEDGKGTIKRAEIFNLSPETYFWTFFEMSSRRQAVTTYQRELPARY